MSDGGGPAATPSPAATGRLAGQWRQYPADDRLAPVLDAALSLFIRYGYHGTTVRMIASEAGMTVPGLYYHYRTKQDMLVDLLRRSNEDIMQRSWAALAEAGQDPRRRFVALIENIVLYMTHRKRLGLVAHELRSLEEPFRSQHVRLRDQLEAIVLAEVERACEADEFASDSPHDSTRAVLVLCQGVADWFTDAGPSSPEQIAEQYVRFSLRLVGAAPEAGRAS